MLDSVSVVYNDGIIVCPVNILRLINIWSEAFGCTDLNGFGADGVNQETACNSADGTCYITVNVQAAVSGRSTVVQNKVAQFKQSLAAGMS